MYKYYDIINSVIILKIKEIRKFNISAYKDGNLLYEGPVGEADESIKNLDIKEIELQKKILRIEV